jgi:hypothetical protein
MQLQPSGLLVANGTRDALSFEAPANEWNEELNISATITRKRHWTFAKGGAKFFSSSLTGQLFTFRALRGVRSPRRGSGLGSTQKPSHDQNADTEAEEQIVAL